VHDEIELVRFGVVAVV